MDRIFKIRTATECINDSKQTPTPKLLFSEFWYEKDVCILFADNNAGKSILAVNIADSISKGVPLQGFKMTANMQKVVYFDLELSDKAFERRYCDSRNEQNWTNYHKFNDNFIRVNRNSRYKVPKGKTEAEHLKDEIEAVIQELDAKVIIIDNLSVVLNDGEKAKNATPFITSINVMADRLGASVLMLAHTTKVEQYRPISKNDLAGSKALSNLVDALFSIGTSSQGKNIRYLKQLKQRHDENKYGEDNVISCYIQKTNESYLEFKFDSYSYEGEHLKEITHEDKQEQKSKIVDWYDNAGMSFEKIAKEIGSNKMTVSRWYHEYKQGA